MEVTIPKVGLTVETVEVLRWHHEVGDVVRAGEALVDLSADKADLEVEAPADGTLARIVLDAGASGAPGDVLAVLQPVGDTDDGVPVLASPALAASSALDAGPREAFVTEPLPGQAVGTTPRSAGGRLRISPLARRVAQRLGVDPGEIHGTGPRGRIVREDVERAAESGPASRGQQDAPAPIASPDGFTPVRWTAARRATAKLMAASAAEAAPVTLHRRAPAELALRAVRRLRADGLPATFNHAVVAAVAGALPGHPALNAVWDGETLLRAVHVHVGIAVDVDGDLLVAVVPAADGLDAVGIVTASAAAVARVRRREPAPAEAATFSVSNLGMFGVEQFTPIITPPQVAVLGVGAVVDGRCHLSLTFDHRAVDGAPAARFLAEVAERLGAFDGG